MVTHSRKSPTMSRISPYVRLSAALALLCFAMIGASQASANGNIISTSPPPLSTLIKFNDRNYEVSAEDWVSMDPISTATVRKIGYGKVTEVNIATTPTGTYSSDGMTSPHVLYPGITVRPVDERHGAVGVTGDPHMWENETAGSSIYRLAPRPAGGYSLTEISPLGIRSCITGGSFTACYVTY